MPDLEHAAADPLADAVTAARREQAARAALSGRQWFAVPVEWVEHAGARFERRVLAALVPRSRWDEVAAADLRASMDEFQSARQDLRNPFHARTLTMLDDVVPFVHERRGVRSGLADVVEALPPLAKRLSPEGIEELIRAEIARRQAIAADPVLLVHHRPAELDKVQAHRTGEQWLIVQHQASGLRARFMYHPDKAEGKVYSRPYGIDSIDLNRVEDREDRAPKWRDYTGLGIGTRLYLRAAQELPNVRWGATSVSPYAEPLRTKLHTLDPWRWRSRTCTCYAAWSELTPQICAETPHELAASKSA
jgi:hypothetical protein